MPVPRTINPHKNNANKIVHINNEYLLHEEERNEFSKNYSTIKIRGNLML